MTAQPSSAGALGLRGTPQGRVCLGGPPRLPPLPGAWGPASHPPPPPSHLGEEPGWSGAGGGGGQAGVTYASWEALLRLYFCMTPWNRPKWAEPPLSGGAADLEGAGQE